MNDIRILGTLGIALLLGLGFLLSKAFGFPMSYVEWPVGILAIIFAFFSLILSGWSE